MKTVLTQSPSAAAEFIRRGGVVAFPTETVYGLGANIFDPAAIEAVFRAKDRPPDNPLIAHTAKVEDIETIAAVVPPLARKLIDAFFPGPLTVVLPKSESVPSIATAGLDTIGVRMPGNALAREFLRECATPVVAPSANLSGRPSPTTWQAVFEDLNGRIDCILQGDPTMIGIESTVIDCSTEIPLLLRKGAIALSRIREVVPEAREYKGDETEAPRSPGLRHRHYSPRAKVFILDKDEVVPNDAAYIGVSDRDEPVERKRVCGGADSYARELFEFFRECDRDGITRIYCEPVNEEGIGAALMDRIRRAAAA